MSTKAIREALARFNVANINLAGTDPESTASIAAALDEVRAIERAARAWGDAPTGTLPKVTEDMLYDISKEAP